MYLHYLPTNNYFLVNYVLLYCTDSPVVSNRSQRKPVCHGFDSHVGQAFFIFVLSLGVLNHETIIFVKYKSVYTQLYPLYLRTG